MTASFRTLSRTVAVGSALAGAFVYPVLPRRVATHFDADGHPDRFGSRASAAFMLPSVMAAMTLLNDRLGGWPGGQDREDRDSGVRARDEAIALTELAILPAHLSILANGLGLRVDMNRVQRGVEALLMIGLGNVLPRLPRNGLVGIRTPWTLADPGVWERTHRLGGYLLMGAGSISLLILPAGGARGARVSRAALVSAIALSTLYSFVAYARRSRLDR